MNMKRILSMLLVCAMAAGLTACGGGSSTAPAQAPAAEEAADPDYIPRKAVYDESAPLTEEAIDAMFPDPDEAPKD